jgi:hypothetical protein
VYDSFTSYAATPPHLTDAAAISVNPHKNERYKEMGKAIRTSALFFLLACSAQAGWMGNGVADPPPPPPDAVKQEPTSAVQEPTEGGYTQGEATGSLTQTVLDLLTGVFSLL